MEALNLCHHPPHLDATEKALVTCMHHSEDMDTLSVSGLLVFPNYPEELGRWTIKFTLGNQYYKPVALYKLILLSERS